MMLPGGNKTSLLTKINVLQHNYHSGFGGQGDGGHMGKGWESWGGMGGGVPIGHKPRLG